MRYNIKDSSTENVTNVKGYQKIKLMVNYPCIVATKISKIALTKEFECLYVHIEKNVQIK